MGQKATVPPEYYERSAGPLFGGLLLLMGVAPLAAWGHSTLRTLGRAVWKPALAVPAVLLPVILSGVRNPFALVGFALASFAAAVTLFEFLRGALARHNRAGENLLVALWRLVGRNRRRYGGYVIHLGVVLMAFGIIGIELFQTQTQGTLAQGEELALGRYTIRYDSLSNFDHTDGRNISRAVVSVFRDGKFVGELHPRRDFYYESQQNMTIPGVRSTWEDDFYVLLVDWQPVSASGATFKVYHNPLVNWLWLGGMVFILGTLVAAWPDKDPEPVAVRVGKRSLAPAGD
jgi:cytochrome c-type biogenesis protein CcmF